jgi:hypothetical protein
MRTELDEAHALVERNRGVVVLPYPQPDDALALRTGHVESGVHEPRAQAIALVLPQYVEALDLHAVAEHLLGLGVTDIHFHVSGRNAVHFRHHKSGVGVVYFALQLICRKMPLVVLLHVFRGVQGSEGLGECGNAQIPDGVDVSALGHFDHRHGIYSFRDFPV